MSEYDDIVTFCPECGVNIPIDEDGLCATCGATATGKGVEGIAIHVVNLRAEIERQHDDLREANRMLDKYHGGRDER